MKHVSVSMESRACNRWCTALLCLLFYCLGTRDRRPLSHIRALGKSLNDLIARRIFVCDNFCKNSL